MKHNNDNQRPAIVANSEPARRRETTLEPMAITDNPCPYPDVYNMGECCGKCPEMLAAIAADKNAA